jgi:hypothetical protein
MANGKPAVARYLPDLIPPAPPVAQDGVMVTRAMLAEAMAKLPFRNVTSAELADALGIPPEPPKVAPWEAAWLAWYDEQQGRPDPGNAWQAAVEWCVGQIADDENHLAAERICRRIMGETK